MKKIIALFLCLFILLGTSGCGSAKIPEDIKKAETLLMASEYNKNSMRAEEKYVNTWAIFSGELDAIYSNSFKIKTSFSSGEEIAIECTLKNSTAKEDLMEFDEGDYIKVQGKIIDLAPGSNHAWGNNYVLTISVDVYAIE